MTHEQDSRPSGEISIEQGLAFIDAVKQLIPVLTPTAFLAEDLQKTWLSINPDTDPEILKDAFKDHVSLDGEAQHLLDGEMVWLSHRESEAYSLTEVRVTQSHPHDDDRMAFVKWYLVQDNHKSEFYYNLHLTDKVGLPIETTIDGFLESMPDYVRQTYQEYLAENSASDANIFNGNRFNEIMDVLGRLSEDTFDISSLV